MFSGSFLDLNSCWPNKYTYHVRYVLAEDPSPHLKTDNKNSLLKTIFDEDANGVGKLIKL